MLAILNALRAAPPPHGTVQPAAMAPLTANTFPEGTHYRGGTYGTDVNMPVPQEEENNPNFDRTACDQTRA
jgi:hypothetical protein